MIGWLVLDEFRESLEDLLEPVLAVEASLDSHDINLAIVADIPTIVTADDDVILVHVHERDRFAVGVDGLLELVLGEGLQHGLGNSQFLGGLLLGGIDLSIAGDDEVQDVVALTDIGGVRFPVIPVVRENHIVVRQELGVLIEHLPDESCIPIGNSRHIVCVLVIYPFPITKIALFFETAKFF